VLTIWSILPRGVQELVAEKVSMRKAQGELKRQHRALAAEKKVKVAALQDLDARAHDVQARHRRCMRSVSHASSQSSLLAG
jgi:hypothetical protein